MRARTTNPTLLLQGLLFLVTTAASLSAWAVTYGTYDPRTLAMGGAGVAVASPQHAQFYNPALMAFHHERAEESRSGRLYLPILTLKAPEAALDVLDLAGGGLDDRVTRTVREFNADPGRKTAAQAREQAQDLRRAIDRLSQQAVTAEAFAGFAVAEPDVHGGGACYVAARVIAGARANISDSDRERLSQYDEVFEFVMSEQAGEPPHPQLFTTDGNLTDPSDTIESTISGRGAAIAEWGLAVGKEFTPFGQAIALGITPKLMDVRVYEKIDHVVDDGLDSFDDGRSHLTGNADLGIAAELESGIRVGMAVKDLVRQTFTTAQGTDVTLRPRTRAGIAYRGKSYTLGFDVDLLENKPIGYEGPVQELAIGAETSPASWLHLRAGYTYNFAQSEATAVAAGVGLELHRFLLDVAYSKHAEHYGASVQLGFAF